MTTTTKRQDYLGRWLGNADPGTTDATDHLGRDVGASDTDFVGRDLTFDNPTAWQAATAYVLGDYALLTGGEIVECTTAGTSDASEPTAPALYGTATDNTAVWKRIL